MSDAMQASRLRVPRDREPTTTPTELAAACAGRSSPSEPAVTLTHVGHYSVEPGTLPGNIENFIGVAQVPIGLAGPLLINGEHAQGEFFVPLATTEGTLVASYNRGMRLLTESGGVRTTVVDESMQRSPVFVFDNALEARQFGEWVRDHLEEVRAAGGVDDERRQADRDPPVRDRSDALSAVQLHDG